MDILHSDSNIIQGFDQLIIGHAGMGKIRGGEGGGRLPAYIVIMCMADGNFATTWFSVAGSPPSGKKWSHLTVSPAVPCLECSSSQKHSHTNTRKKINTG